MSEVNKKLGDLLRLERERRGLKLDKIAGELKIPETTLRAIEDGDPSTLPSELYFKLFAKSYAEHLGIDYGRTLDAMREELGELDDAAPAAPEAKVAESPRPETRKRKAAAEQPASETSGMMKRLVIIGGIIIVAFIVFVAVYFFFLKGPSDGPGPNVDRSTAEELQPSQESAGGRLAEQYNWGSPELKEPDSLVLTLTAREPSWATVLADGDTALYQNLNPARVYRIAAKYRLLVSIGVPRFVQVTLNDQPAFLADAESGRISRVEINQVNREQFSAPPQAERPTRVSAIGTSSDTSADTTGARDGVENW